MTSLNGCAPQRVSASYCPLILAQYYNHSAPLGQANQYPFGAAERNPARPEVEDGAHDRRHIAYKVAHDCLKSPVTLTATTPISLGIVSTQQFIRDAYLAQMAAAARLQMAAQIAQNAAEVLSQELSRNTHTPTRHRTRERHHNRLGCEHAKIGADLNPRRLPWVKACRSVENLAQGLHNCAYQVHCLFAHTLSELIVGRVAAGTYESPAYKTRLCVYVQKGNFCVETIYCLDAHSLEELANKEECRERIRFLFNSAHPSALKLLQRKYPF